MCREGIKGKQDQQPRKERVSGRRCVGSSVHESEDLLDEESLPV